MAVKMAVTFERTKTKKLENPIQAITSACYFYFCVRQINIKIIDTKQSNKRNNQNSKSKRQDYNIK